MTLRPESDKSENWKGLRKLWHDVLARQTPGWAPGKALEYLVLRAFELDEEKPVVRYPYLVELFGSTVEQIDGAVHLPGLSCLIESKDWEGNVGVAPIAKMRNQLLRRPAGTIGLIFAMEFTEPAKLLAQFTMPQAVLLWAQVDLQVAMEAECICRFLRKKHLVCCEKAVPDYNLSEEEIP